MAFHLCRASFGGLQTWFSSRRGKYGWDVADVDSVVDRTLGSSLVDGADDCVVC